MRFIWDEAEYGGVSQGVIEVYDPQVCFAFRWWAETETAMSTGQLPPNTRVEFTLSEVSGGTRLTLIESGFAALPEATRRKAYAENDSGWHVELQDLVDYLGVRQEV